MGVSRGWRAVRAGVATKKSRYNTVRGHHTPSTYQSCPQRKRERERDKTLYLCLRPLSGEIKTDQNVIFKSLNLYKIAAHKTQSWAKQPPSHKGVALSGNSPRTQSCLSPVWQGVIAYNNNINTWFSPPPTPLLTLLSDDCIVNALQAT